MSAPQEILINLLEVDRKGPKRRRMATIAVVLIIVLVGVLVGTYFSALGDNRTQQALNRELKVEVAKYDDVQDALEGAETMKEQVGIKNNAVAQVEAMQVSYIMVIREIALAVPAGVIVINTRIAPGQINIDGYAADYAEASAFLSGLRRSPVFKDVNVVSLEADEESGQTEFSIESAWGVDG